LKGPNYFKPNLTRFVIWWREITIGFY
jgi:hypothetical protein